MVAVNHPQTFDANDYDNHRRLDLMAVEYLMAAVVEDLLKSNKNNSKRTEKNQE